MRDYTLEFVRTNAEHFKATGVTTVYLRDGNYPWSNATDVEPSGSYRLSGPCGMYVVSTTAVPGLEIKWSVDFERREANGSGYSQFDRERLREVAVMLPPDARRKFAQFLGDEVLKGMQVRTDELRAALNQQLDSQDCVLGLIEFAKSRSSTEPKGTAFGYALDAIEKIDAALAKATQPSAAAPAADNAAPAPAAAGSRWRHKKRGTTYQEIGRGPLQASNGPPNEGDTIVCYRGDDGRLFFREATEFDDGRFERLPATAAAPAAGAVARIIIDSIEALERSSTTTPVVEFLAMLATPSDHGGREACWLLEWADDVTGLVRWWHPDHGWCIDANKAIRFSRECDAASYVANSLMSWAKPTEHIFVNRAALSPQSASEG